MKINHLAGALALSALVMPAAAMADDPNDRSMRSAEARSRDAAIIRQLNRDQLRYVQQRDAQYAEGWQAYRDYPRHQADHQRRMEEWRHAVRMCESGHHEYCAR